MIPQAVMNAAADRKHLGGTLKLLGHNKGKEVYTYFYPEPMTIGMPELYLWDGARVQTIGGEEALAIISSFCFNPSIISTN